MFVRRIQKLKKKIKQEKLDGVLISSVSNITYLTGYANFSREEREAYIFIGNNFAYIITDGRYSEAVKKQVPHLQLFERGNGKSTKDLFKRHKKEIKKIGIEEDNLTVAEHRVLKKHFKNLKHFSVSRSIKDEKEIEKIEKAAKLGDKTFKFILGKIKSGITEKKLAFEIELFIKTGGGDISFPTIIGFGKNSSVPHHQTGNAKLKKRDFVLLDFGIKLEEYCSDMTRTVFFGSPNKEQRKIYEVVLKAQKRAVDFINSCLKSGKEIKASMVDKVARDYITFRGYPPISHSLGHGIGLEVHEHPHLSPKSKDILREGMVFSIEPGIYLPDFGGIRIEDLFVLGKHGVKQITNSPKNLIEV